MILPYCFTHIMKSWLQSYLRHLRPTHFLTYHSRIGISFLDAHFPFVFFEAYTCVFVYVYVYEVLMSHLRKLYFLWERIDVNTNDGNGKTSYKQRVHEQFKTSPRMMEMHWLLHQPKEDMSWAFINLYNKLLKGS